MIVIVTVAGSDPAARSRVASGLAEWVFERAAEISGTRADGENAGDAAASNDPLAQAFAEQLIVDDRGYGGGFSALDRSDVDCFAGGMLDSIDQPRRAELTLTLDNIPLLFQADWSDQEIETLTEVLDRCVGDDTATGTEAFATFGFPSRTSDCLVPEIIERLGERYYLERFSAMFTPPRIEARDTDALLQAERAGQPGPSPQGFETFLTDMEPIFEACGVPIGPSEYDADEADAVPACDGPCAEEENAAAMNDLQIVVLVCSRDPYVPQFVMKQLAGNVNAGVDDASCSDRGRGTLVAVQREFACPQGPRQIRVPVTDELVTEQAVTAACAEAP